MVNVEVVEVGEVTVAEEAEEVQEVERENSKGNLETIEPVGLSRSISEKAADLTTGVLTTMTLRQNKIKQIPPQTDRPQILLPMMLPKPMLKRQTEPKKRK